MKLKIVIWYFSSSSTMSNPLCRNKFQSQSRIRIN